MTSRKFDPVEGLLLLVALIWALNFSVVKLSLPYLDPMAFNALRFAVAIVLMVGLSVREGVWVPIRKGHGWRLFFLGLLGNTAYQLFFIFGLARTNSANASVILGTIPVWVALFAHLLSSEKLNRTRLTGVLVTTTGVALILAGSANVEFDTGNLWGDLLVLGSAAVFGLYTVRSKNYLNHYAPLQLTTMSMVCGGGTLLVAGLPALARLDWSAVPWAAWVGVLFSGLLSIGISYIIWNHAIRKVGAVRTALFQNAVPVIAVAIGVVVLGETLLWNQWLGSALAILGIVVTRRG